MRKKKRGETAMERYARSRNGKRTRRAWAKRNPARLRANVQRHRARMRALRGVGDALRERFPRLTGAAGATAKPETGHPAGAAGTTASPVGSPAGAAAPSSPCGHVLEDHFESAMPFPGLRPCSIPGCPCNQYRGCGGGR